RRGASIRDWQRWRPSSLLPWRRLIEIEVGVAVGAGICRQPAEDLVVRVPEAAVDGVPPLAAAAPVDPQPPFVVGGPPGTWETVEGIVEGGRGLCRADGRERRRRQVEMRIAIEIALEQVVEAAVADDAHGVVGEQHGLLLARQLGGVQVIAVVSG